MFEPTQRETAYNGAQQVIRNLHREAAHRDSFGMVESAAYSRRDAVAWRMVAAHIFSADLKTAVREWQRMDSACRDQVSRLHEDERAALAWILDVGVPA